LRLGKTFRDPEGRVNPSNKEIEVDIFCQCPLIIGECTSYVKADEISKSNDL